MAALPALQELSGDFRQIADAVERRTGEMTALTAADERCARLAPQATGPHKALLEDLSQRLRVWRDVWPRLSKDAGFRAAVSRESRLWADKLHNRPS